MDDAPATLLLTRPEAQSKAFLADCEAKLGRRLPVVISPLLRIEPMGELPDLDPFDTIILTSGNSVRRLGTALSGRRVFTVGEKTAALARAQGADANSLGEDVDAFLAASHDDLGRTLFCRGVHSRGDLAAHMTRQGAMIEEVVLYDQVAVPLSDAALKLLRTDAAVIAPVFSPRTAQLLSDHPGTSALKVIAISAATAEAWSGDQPIQIAAHPNAEEMRRLVIAAF